MILTIEMDPLVFTEGDEAEIRLRIHGVTSKINSYTFRLEYEMTSKFRKQRMRKKKNIVWNPQEGDSITLSEMITRGIAEIARLGVKMGGKLETFTGLTGIGDLIVTCASVHSRNRRAGYLMGQGKTMQEAMDEVQMVVEGVYSAKAARKLAEKYEVSMPIVEQINEVLFENKSAAQAVDELMLRESKSEHSVLPWPDETV